MDAGLSHIALAGLAGSIAAVVGLAMSCGTSSSGGDDDDGVGAHATGGGGQHAGGTSGTGATGAAGTGGSAPGGGGGGLPSFPMCLQACGMPADCDLGIPPNDADNYACSEGACRYLGCNSDPECQGIGDYVCRELGLGTRSCVMACAVPEDCVVAGSGPAYDVDNYGCSEGYCHYLGCNSEPECQSLGNYVCRDAGGGVAFCVTPCSSPEQCATGSLPYDADNYACIDGWCHYQGCNSDTECQALGNYVCR